MKTLAGIATLCAATCIAQDIPQAPRPNQPVFRVDDYVGIVALAGFHFGDIYTTREFMSNPCKCMHEINPIAPHTPAWVPQIAYHGAWIAANTYVTYQLEKHHKRGLAWTLRLAQTSVEAYEVHHNQSVINRVNKERTK